MIAVLLILQLLQIVSRSLFIIYLLNFKFKRSCFFALHLFVSLLFALGAYLIPFFSAAIPGLPFDIPYKLIVDILLSFLLIFSCSSDRFSRKLSVLAWEKIILMSAELLCTLVYSGITGISPVGISAIGNQSITLIVILNILYDGIYFALAYFVSFILSGRRRQGKSIREFTPATLIISIQILLFCTAVFKQGSHFSTTFTIIAFVVMIICILSDIYLIMIAPPKTAENRTLQERLRCMEEIQAGERVFFSSLLEKEHEMSALRHDWNNLLQLVAAQMADNQKSDVNDQTTISLIQALMNRVNETRLNRYCQNETVNVLLNAKAKILKEKSVPFEISCTITEQTPVDPLELCSLFSHLIDHAVEACTVYPSDENLIKVSAKMPSANSIAIRVSSRIPLLTQKKFYRPTTPSNKRNDYGMEIVRSIIQKYNGNFDITSAHKTLTASVFFNQGNAELNRDFYSQ